MKALILSSKIAAIFIALALTLSCSDDNGDSPGSSSSSGTGGSFELPDISSQLCIRGDSPGECIEYKGSGEINFVYGHEVHGKYDSKEDYSTVIFDTIPAGKIQNGQIVFDEAFDFPQNVDSKYLIDITDFFFVSCDDFNYCESNVSYTQNISMAWVFFVAVIPGKEQCMLIMGARGGEGGAAWPFYASASGQVMGTHKRNNYEAEYSIYDMNFSKGWNMFYLTDVYTYGSSEGFYETSTSTDPKLIEGTLEWITGCGDN
ncbi:MAG: hypothetical protein LBU89_08295 [Fibromonadaceae bacterium]|jgi:hypothetical protein|nr:hypothetical protein [Fibromonadaceae bacterium]